MIKRGRWSTEDQRAVVPGAKVPPPPPPPELDDVEAVIWRGIVSDLPGDWFAPESQPMLKELCRHVRHADDLMQDLRAVRAALAEVTAGSGPVPTQSEAVATLTNEVRALLRAHGYQSERIGNLATKLRLTNQAKVVVTAAARKAKETPSRAPEPWDDWGKQPKPQDTN